MSRVIEKKQTAERLFAEILKEFCLALGYKRKGGFWLVGHKKRRQIKKKDGVADK